MILNLFIKWSMCGFQESVLSTIRPRNLVYRLLEILLLSKHIMSMCWLFFVLKCIISFFCVMKGSFFLNHILTLIRTVSIFT